MKKSFITGRHVLCTRHLQQTHDDKPQFCVQNNFFTGWFRLISHTHTHTIALKFSD